MGQPSDQTCDSCEQSMSGYTRSELEADGWVWHMIRKGKTVIDSFVMCDVCVETYARRREAKGA